MEIEDIVRGLGALAQPHRLAIYRHLVRRGMRGSPVGDIRGTVGLPPATLSHHLAQLLAAGLVTRQRDGRSLIYRADFRRMQALVDTLSSECCRDDPCMQNEGMNWSYER